MLATVHDEAMSPRKREREIDTSTYRGRLGAKIRARRIELDISVATLAEALGVAVQTVYGWEFGEHGVEIDRLPEIAKILKTDVHSIIPKK